ncbi:hypothetical protein [Taibaiella koreensis]|uniref:hypothetical protein n=1 Tax=Taibaiella koreensis TaxID=1268548 RepID=UPI000E59CA4F|nr:hypothetical protein [Taibaiella koreensis]
MKKLYSLFFIAFITTSFCQAQQRQQVVLTAEDSVRNLIEALPEVREKDHVYDSLTNRRQNIIIRITPPDSAVAMYHVEAGYQGNNRFQPHFYFYVDLANNMIYIEDLERGDRTTLEEWRARRSRAKDQK